MTPAALRERASRPLVVAGQRVDVRVRESARAKTTRLLVGAQRPLEIIVPAGTSDDEIDRLLEAKRGWITRKTAHAREVADRPHVLGLDKPGVVWLAGDELPIAASTDTPPGARLRDGVLFVAEDEQAQMHAAVERWYRRAARRAILQSVDQNAERIGLHFNRVTVRDQKTRWGSCSRAGNLAFNWRLVLAPQAVLNYVVVHELCHLREPSHSKAFWRALEVAEPNWRIQDRWLRDHGSELRSYEPRVMGKVEA